MTDQSHSKTQTIYRVKFELQGLPATTNSIGRKHWALKAKEAKFWRDLVRRTVTYDGLKPKEPLKKASLVLTRFSSRSPDPDGIVSSFKHIIDGLVDAGVIENDTMDIIGFPDYRWEKAASKDGKVRVEVIAREEDWTTGN